MNILSRLFFSLLIPSVSILQPGNLWTVYPHTNAKSLIHLSSLNLTAKSLSPVELMTSFQYPNGITHASDGTVYVGSITRGDILRISPEGDMEIFFSDHPEVFAGTSLRLDEARGILWGASPNIAGLRLVDGTNASRTQETNNQSHRIFAINISSGELIQVLSLPDGGFGNDLAIDRDGGVYVTDSTEPRVYYLAPGTTQFQVWAEDERFESDNIGLAGIALHPSGVAIVSKYSDGELLKITPQEEMNPSVEVIDLPRSLANPDGIQFAPDGSLLVTEGAVETGNGRLIGIDVLSSSPGPKQINVLAENLESPVNLTVIGQDIWVTESHIRHLFIEGEEDKVPNQFYIRRFSLSQAGT